MKNIIFTLLLSWSSIGQITSDTTVLENGTLIKQQLDDSTIFVKHSYKTNDEISYTKVLIDDSLTFIQNITEGKQYVKLILLKLINGLWVESSAITTMNGLLISIRELDEKGTGYARQFSDNGNILSASEIENFNNNGQYFGFYSNGSLKEKGKYKDNLKIGEWISFDINGDTLSVENYTIKELCYLKIEIYTSDELNFFQWGGTSENELVSLRHGVFKTYIRGKLESKIVFVEGKMKE